MDCSLTCQASLSISNSQSLLKPISIESVMPSNHLILCHSLPPLPSVFPSLRVFSKESTVCIRWPKYWSFSFSISPSNEYSRLITFRIDWFDLLAVQGTLKSLLQYHSSKASVLWCSAFFIVQLSHPCTTTGKTIVLTRQTFVGKVTSLLLNMLSTLVIAFLPRRKRLFFFFLSFIFISWRLITLQYRETLFSWAPKSLQMVTAAIKLKDACYTLTNMYIVNIQYSYSLIAQSIKNLHAMQETRIWFLGWEDLLEKEMATHSSILAWEILWTEEPGRLQSMGYRESDTT